MRLPCPRCGHVLEYSTVSPRFCSNCGVPLGAPAPPTPVNPRPDALTVPNLVPIHDQATLTYVQPQAGHSVPPDVVGGYRLLRAIGRGGMGTVWEAEEQATGRRVAIKLISPEFADSPDTVERFRREGRLASTILHPRCVFVLAADEDLGRPYIVMELMPGRNLHDLMQEKGPLPVQEAVRRILDVIEGLQEAHRCGVIHRDVKPSNCFLDTEDRIKVGDFGLAKSLLGPEHLTRSGSFLGTVLFASPEQIRNEAVDHRTDVYSVCGTLYYLLTGRAPFEETDPAAALARTMTDPVPSMRQFRPSIPRTLDEVVRRGLARSRRQRWQSLEDLRLALVPFLGDAQCLAEPRWRVSAYLVDLLLLIPLELLVQFLAGRAGLDSTHGIVSLFNSLLISLSCGLVYFAIPEWAWGCSPGKFLMRLRVRERTTGDRPSLGRSVLRMFWFYLCLDLTTVLTAIVFRFLGLQLFHDDSLDMNMRVVVNVVLVALLPFLSGSIGLGLLAVTMRRRNGYRGVHEVLSGTGVIRLPVSRPRFKAPARATWPGKNRLPEGVPFQVGVFSLHAIAQMDAAGNDLVAYGADAALHRPVWLWLRRDESACVPPVRQIVARATRPRWLAAGSQDGWHWDAFVAAPGCLLGDLVGSRWQLPWADALRLLEQVAEELELAEKEGSLPGRLSPEQVWVQASGQVLLLDAPPRAPTLVASPLDLLRQTAAVALEGRVRLEGDLNRAIQAPVPRHASSLLERLMTRDEGAFTSVAAVREALALAHELPEEIGRPTRAFQVAVTSAGVSLGLFSVYVLGSLLLLAGYLICVMGAASGEVKREQIEACLTSVGADKDRPPPPTVDAAWFQQQKDDLRELNRDMEQLARDRTIVLASSSWFLSKRLEPSEERFRKEYVQRLREYSVDDESPEKGFDYLVAMSDDLLAGPSGLAAEVLREWWPVQALAFWPVVWALWAGLTRGGLAPRLAGVALVGRDGRPAARWRCAWRALLVWMPVALLLFLSLWLDVWRVASARDGWTDDEIRLAGWLSWHAWWAAVLLLPIYVFAAISWPNRGLHDRLSGVHPVPR